METIKSVFTTYQFNVEVVTPVHVGMAQEKNYVRGLAYVLTNNEAWIISTEMLFQSLDKTQLATLTLRLADGKADLLEKMLLPIIKSRPDVVLQKFAVHGQPNGGIIRRLYRSGLGQYAIPGSSVKGAIRSVFLAELKKQPGSNLQRDELDKLMGNITNNLMRFIQVGDVALTETQIGIRRTKIYAADSVAKGTNERGEWKHANSGSHNPKFINSTYTADAFVTFYETALPDPAPENSSTLTIRMGSHLPHQLGQYAVGTAETDYGHKPNVPNYTTLLKGCDGAWLANTIQLHTRQYLTREIAYFGKFDNRDLNEKQSMLDYLRRLLAENDEPGSCLLRVGAGVGFHSITGDWQDRSQVDHAQSWIDSDGEETLNGQRRETHLKLKNQIFAKTRKFAFEQVDGSFKFSFMGFIKLTLLTPESIVQREEKRVAAHAQAAEAEAKRLVEEANVRQQAEEARKPRLFDGILKMQQELDAEIVVSAKINKVKVYTDGYETRQFDLIGYSGAEPVGKVVIVRVDQLDKKKNLTQVRYLKLK